MDGELEKRAVIGRAFGFGPAPAPYDLPFERPQADAAALAAGGLVQWHLEYGHDLTGKTQSWTSRHVSEVVAPGGLQGAANVQINFDPAFERVDVHWVRVLRDGLWREAADADSFQFFQRETNLERAQFDGRITAHMVVADLRVGDLVDACYSIAGANPALKGRLGSLNPLQWDLPGYLRRYRLRTRKDRAIRFEVQGLEPVTFEENAEGEIIERVWELRSAKPFVYERDVPPSWIGHAQVSISDSLNWSEVADLFEPYYSTASELPSELGHEVDRIRGAYEGPTQYARELLRLVQTELRYHSVGLGEGGYVPRSIEEIWRTRFGDCKDASRLLVQLLRSVGLDAAPALVNTFVGEGLREGLPSVRAFNHCIVRLHLDGQVYWLDPTMPPQGGSLDRLVQARYGAALPLTAGADLEDIPHHAAEVVLRIVERWSFSPFPEAQAEAEFQLEFGSWHADGLRLRLANDGLDKLARGFKEFAEQNYGALEVLAPLEVTDDDQINCLKVVERYRFLKPWRMEVDGSDHIFSTADDVVGPHLVVQETPSRIAPINLGTPRIVESDRTFEFDFPVEDVHWDKKVEGPGVSYHLRAYTANPRTHRVMSRLSFVGARVEAADSEALYEFCRRSRSMRSYNHRRSHFEAMQDYTRPGKSWSEPAPAVLIPGASGQVGLNSGNNAGPNSTAPRVEVRSRGDRAVSRGIPLVLWIGLGLLMLLGALLRSN